MWRIFAQTEFCELLCVYMRGGVVREVMYFPHSSGDGILEISYMKGVLKVKWDKQLGNKGIWKPQVN
jgi:hypothetical protein